MKAVALAALLAPLADAHYIFSILQVNGVATGGDYAHIRKNSNTYMPSFTSEIVNSPELRCNKGATAGSTKTMAVKAGDQLGFKLAYSELIEHPGPGFIYMSKAPGSVSSYDGSGEWFKVWESGLCGGSPGNDASWCTWQKDSMSFTIPKEIEDGEYLVRAEHIGLHEGHEGKAQFYMECAQVSITGGSGGTPSPTVQIPGLYSANDAGIAFNKWNNPTSYTMPGGPVAKFSGSGGASAPSGGADNSTEIEQPSTPQQPTTPDQGAPQTPGQGAPQTPGQGAPQTPGQQQPGQPGGQFGGQPGGQFGGQSSGQFGGARPARKMTRAERLAAIAAERKA